MDSNFVGYFALVSTTVCTDLLVDTCSLTIFVASS